MPGRPTKLRSTTATPGIVVELRARGLDRLRSSRAAAPRRAAPAGAARRPARPSAATTARSSAPGAWRGPPPRGRSRLAVADVQHRACVSEPAILCVLVSTASAPCVSAAGRQRLVEAEVRAPGLVDDQRHARGVGDLGAARHVGRHPVVGGRDDERRAGVGRAASASRSAPARRRGPCPARRRTRAGRTPAPRPRARARRPATRASCAAPPPASRAAPARGTARGCPASRRWSETTCARRRGPRRRAARPLVRRRRRPEVDPPDVLRDVEPQRPLAEAEAQPGVGALPALWPGTWKRVGPGTRTATTASR